MCLIAAGAVCAVHWTKATRVERVDAVQMEKSTDRKLAQAMTTSTTMMVIGKP
jgi:hypothetical protein